LNKGHTGDKVNGKDVSLLRTVSRRTWWGLRRRVVLDGSLAEGLLETLGEPGLLRLDASLGPSTILVDHPRRRTHRLADGAGHLIVKFEFFPFPNWLLTLPRSPIGMREMKNLRIITALGAKAFTPVLAGDVSWGPFFFQSFIATREVLGGCSLSQWLRDNTGHWQEQFSRAEVLGALPRLAEMLATLHARGFYCCSPVTKNVYICHNEHGAIDFYLHDFPRPRYRPDHFSKRLASHDVARVDRWAMRWMTRRERFELLTSYLSHDRESSPDRATLLSWLRWLTHHRKRILRQTYLTWQTHWVRRRSKQIPFFGKWWR
jgi:hypothetical protein